jgi:hypothetical protein
MPSASYQNRRPDMLTIETIATVKPDGTLIAKAPAHATPGKHRVVIALDETPLDTAEQPQLPDLSEFRRSLGCPVYPGVSVVDYRQEERS